MAIPSSKLLVKDHKPKDKWGKISTRLVIPMAMNFNAAFTKLGYLGIKNIFDEAKINYTRKTIVQASTAKKTLELLGIRKSAHALISLDIMKLYPSVTYRLMGKTVLHYAPTPPPSKVIS
jgi:hypothetical protein